ncbi:kinase-like domain-containing protein [Chytriomyces sp. MP71]|nr:kinase-like domain-containing protein [Chytriomyces sp. MP71]
MVEIASTRNLRRVPQPQREKRGTKATRQEHFLCMQGRNSTSSTSMHPSKSGSRPVTSPTPAFTPSPTPSPHQTFLLEDASPGTAPPAKAEPAPRLYAGLTQEEKARIATIYAFTHSKKEFSIRYDVDEIMGFGSNGTILSAIDTLTNTPCAIKIIYKHHAAFDTPLPAEIAVLRATSHTSRYLIEYIQDWQDVHHFYLVTARFGTDWRRVAETFSGEPITETRLEPLTFLGGMYRMHTLPISFGSNDLFGWAHAQRLQAIAREGHARIAFAPVKRIVKQTAAGLLAMHKRGFYHGDCKLENILVHQPEGTICALSIRLIDFGHSKPLTVPLERYGTRLLCAPEYFPDSPYAPHQRDMPLADVFALGIMMFMLLNEDGAFPTASVGLDRGSLGFWDLMELDSGRFPFDWVEDLDLEAWDLLQGMCHVDPNKRFGMKDVLEHPWLADIVV